MATIKNIPDSYTVNVPTMTVNGNLYITGNSTNIYSTNLTVEDNIIVLNGNVTGTPMLNAGININRGSAANVTLQWTEYGTSGVWQLTNDGTNFANIALAGNLNVGGNLNITGHTIYDTANTVTFYTGTVSSGKSGIFVDNTNGGQQELATKSAAVAFSIIFG
jgi:hypothetical protein